ncbi:MULTISPECIES: type IV secretory system conjugative DNA transfer family protein [Acetobacter]|uniref:type IV secretory system conjugative DNA transfer family protein n=1 Tax=Acetobacter TaxID=434 RepID=UPI000F58A2EE|nr:type IV secretory system conjugative DNA transfer family protein [Acetobacter pasteurianus]GCD57113.1 conjugal transfer protein TraI [Acetobacter pasteurianus NBRC 3222]
MRKTIHYTLMACTMLATFVRPGLAEEAPHIDGRLIPFKTSAPPPAPNGTLVPMPQPPEPAADDIEQAEPALANPTNKPITGAQELDKIVGGDRPLSLEALQNTRPNDEGSDGLKPGRKEALQEAAHIYGAQGGLAARSFAINEMLRRYEDTLDATFDFRSLVLPIGSGQTLMQPPIVTEAQMAFALNGTGQVAHETQCVFEITREAQLTSAPPNWRTYLVRSWRKPQHPAAAALPMNRKEVGYWNDWVAEGWAAGEKQATEIFLSDLSRLQRDIVGMARYRVLLANGRVEEPHVVFEQKASVGGGDTLHVGDRVVRITSQPGLRGLRRDRGYGFSAPLYPERCR